MRVLFISNRNRHFENTNTYREKAIFDLGHESIFFDHNRFFLPGRIRENLPLLHRWDLKRLNNLLLDTVKETRPDVCLSVGGYYNLPETITALKELGISTVLWTTDAPDEYFTHIIETAHLYDRIFCAGTEAMELLAEHRVLNTEWLPFACDPFYHRPIQLDDDQKNRLARDIVFVGSYYPNRWAILKELVNLNIGIWGPGWGRVIDDRNRNFINDVHLNHSEWVKIYNAAKIVVIIHYQDGQIPCYQASPKIFESMACKSFVLSDEQKDIFRIFRSGKHLVAFQSLADMKEKIEYFLNHEDERKEIAKNGYDEVIKKHTYRHRLKEILSSLETKMR